MKQTFTYNLKFAKGNQTFILRSEPSHWLAEESFRELLLQGVEEGGRFVESWRTPVRKNNKKKGR